MDPTQDPEWRMAKKKAAAPWICEHANENPNVCPCPPNCYCKTRTCKGKQPSPTANKNPLIKDLVIKDIRDRSKVGFQRYGMYLQAHNGRDALRDAYEEAVDLVKYLRQALFERDGK